MLLLALVPAAALHAQRAQPTPTAAAASDELPASADDELTAAETDQFLNLGDFVDNEQSLYGPYDARYITVRLPATWQLEPGAELRLDYKTFIGGSTTTVTDAVGLGGFMDVRFNNVSLGQIVLDESGEHSLTLPISTTAFKTDNPDGSHVLSFSLDAGLHCNDAAQTNVVLRNTTVLVLPHSIVPPPTDLENLPLPLYQKSLEDDLVTVVVPDAASVAEVRAALIVSAALGQQTFNQVTLQLLPVSKLASVEDTDHIVLVGRAQSLGAVLKQMDLPAAPTASGFASPLIQPDDGVLQMVQSPWNADRVVLVVSGSSDAGVIKASQALSNGHINPTDAPNLAVVADVNVPSTIVTDTAALATTGVITPGNPITVRLSNLGYDTRTAFGIGAHYLDYQFVVPNGTELSDEGTLELHFAHSNLLDFDVSGMLVKINDHPISSVRFDENSSQRGSVQLRIPKNTIQPGPNTLLISADLVPQTPCIDPNLAGVWMAIQNDSLLSLPLQPKRDDTRPAMNLLNYQRLLTEERSLSNLAIIVPPAAPTAWQVAAKLVADLANQVPAGMQDFAVLFSDQALTETLALSNIMLVGQPAKLPWVAEQGPQFPLVFPPDSNLPTLGNERVLYRLPADLSRGYLTLARSPYDPGHVVLGVLGSTTEGLDWAGRALLLGRLRSQLDGTVAIVNDERVSVEDTALSSDTSILAENAIPEAEVTETYLQTQPVEKPKWVLYVIAVSMVLMWLILAFVGVRALRRRRQRLQHE